MTPLPLPPPRTSSTIPPVLQHTTPIDAAENPEIMSYPEQESRPKKNGYPIPLIRLEFRDVCSDGAKVIFNSGLNLHDVLIDAVYNVQKLLYTPDNCPTSVRSVTLIVRGMDGVAYTTGMDLDRDHKEIHFSTDYIAGVHERGNGKDDRQEILGVIRHEMVHCFQYNSRGTANGGLIEGIADWIRYKGGFIPAHWHPGSGDNWDDAYERTGYFLLWLEKQYGPQTVPRINAWMKDKYYSDQLFVDLFGEKPEDLFKKYKEHYKDKPKSEGGDCDSPGTEQGEEHNNDGDDQSYVEVGDREGNATLFQSEAKLVARDRLCKLTFDGSGSLKRFFNSFESLIETLDSNMPDRDRRLLLVTALSGVALSWLDTIDPEDEMSYGEIRANLEANALFQFKSTAGNAAGVRESTKLAKIL
ncbi:hypothetical protein H072_693 [Dactylellina haptotyla CBS 200.50]|uniref:Uncharacterized protein n=1 Tax=Dactylellina haptotyla (strain CBS 200.50) TaxID=1284197 RepID=S8AWH4_DACHA|nr:hypothetical protein H072_693 [Dactylellina haptotyla CBS 200.50]